MGFPAPKVPQFSEALNSPRKFTPPVYLLADMTGRAATDAVKAEYDNFQTTIYKEIAREIRAVADKDKVVILAEAYKQAEQLRGQGDAEAAGIYAESFSQDPEFYEFTRSMKAYVETFESKSDVMLIDSESEFFKYLNDKKDEN